MITNLGRGILNAKDAEIAMISVTLDPIMGNKN